MALTFSLDWSSVLAPEEQLAQQLAAFAEAGLLSHTHQLPTVRELAVQLNVPPALIEAAYRRFQNRGLTQLLSDAVYEAQSAGYSREQILQAVDALLKNHV